MKMKREDFKDQKIYELVRREIEREEFSLILIASENYVNEEILEIQGCVLTNKYAEGYPSKRYYSGCRYLDEIEDIAIERAKTLFGAEHVNVQPHSGSSANMAVFYATLNPGDKILGMDIAHGGHLTHGARVSFSGKFYQAIGYKVSPESEMLDYDEIRAIALREKPKMIIAGASAYPRTIDFAKFREIADEAGAYFTVDMAHIAGLIATGCHPSPMEHAHFVTTTTHKTLRGPRGGLVFCKKEFAKAIDSAVFPGLQGGPLMHVIAAKAVAFQQAMAEEFTAYQKQVIANAKRLCNNMEKRGYRIVLRWHRYPPLPRRSVGERNYGKGRPGGPGAERHHGKQEPYSLRFQGSECHERNKNRHPGRHDQGHERAGNGPHCGADGQGSDEP